MHWLSVECHLCRDLELINENGAERTQVSNSWTASRRYHTHGCKRCGEQGCWSDAILRVLRSEIMQTSAFTSSRTERTTLPAVGWPHTMTKRPGRPWVLVFSQPPHAPPTSDLFLRVLSAWPESDAPNLQLWAQRAGVDVRITHKLLAGPKMY